MVNNRLCFVINAMVTSSREITLSWIAVVCFVQFSLPNHRPKYITSDTPQDFCGLSTNRQSISLVSVYLAVCDAESLLHYFQSKTRLYRRHRNSVFHVSLKYLGLRHYIYYIAGVPGRILEILYERPPPIHMILHQYKHTAFYYLNKYEVCSNLFGTLVILIPSSFLSRLSWFTISDAFVMYFNLL